MQIHTLQLVCLIFTEKNIFKKPGFTWILWWTPGDVTSWTSPGAWLQENTDLLMNTEPTERFWPWHPKKMISDSQKITIPSTPTAAASTLQYFHLHRSFKASNDVNYVKKKKKRTLVMNMIHIYLIEVNLAPLMWDVVTVLIWYLLIVSVSRTRSWYTGVHRHVKPHHWRLCIVLLQPSDINLSQ